MNIDLNSFLFLVFPDFLFPRLSPSHSSSLLSSRLFLSEEVSGYSYCWCWLLINRVPSYQPTHDWLLSTKEGEKKEGKRGGRWWCSEVALGNHETCVNLNRDLGKSSRRLCVCAQVCGCMRALGLFFAVALLGQSSGDTDPSDTPLNTPPTPAECPLNTPIQLAPLLALNRRSARTPPPHKDMGSTGRETVGLEMISSSH